MKKLLGILLVLIAGIGIGFSANVSAQSQYEIPSWVKGVANFWVEGNIDDAEFGESLSFLIEQGIIKVDMPQQVNSGELERKISVLESENSKLKNEYAEMNRKISQLESENSKLRLQLTESQSEPEPKSASGFSALTCKKDYSGMVQLTGKYTADRDYSFLTIEFGILDASGRVLDTGAGFINNISAGQTKLFTAQSLYTGDYHTCEVQVSAGM